MAKAPACDTIMPGMKMKPLLTLSRRQPVPAAIALTKDGEGLILLDKKMQPRKLASVLKAQAAKADIELNTATLRFGRAEVDGEEDAGTIRFVVNKDAPGAMRTKLREVVKKIAFKDVEINVDAGLEDEADEDEAEPAIADPPPPPPPGQFDAAELTRELTGLIARLKQGTPSPELVQFARTAGVAIKAGDADAARSAIDALASGMGGGGNPDGDPDPGPGDTPPQTRGKHADTLEALHAELGRVQAALVGSDKPSKPSVLIGKFRYGTSVVGSTATRLKQLADEDVVGAAVSKDEVKTTRDQLARALTAARDRQVDLSLGRLEHEVEEHATALARLQALQEQLDAERDPAKQAQQRAYLYAEASGLLSELSVDAEDWSGQIREAQPLIAAKRTEFDVGLGQLLESQAAMEDIVAACLPKLTARPGGPNETAPTNGGGVAVAEITDPAAALKACGNSWVTAKQTYGASKTEMQKLADYRKREVDAWLNTTLAPWGMAEGPNKGWVSVGSSDPTSDYDISLNRHGEQQGRIRYDYEFVKDFNDWFRKRFGGEGGTVFDTNLYASAPAMVTDADPDAPDTNDVAALMKMRRYMAPGEFEAFRVATVDACAADPAEQMKVEQQFSAADDNYRIVLMQLIEGSVKTLDARLKERAAKPQRTEEDDAADLLERTGRDEMLDWLKRGEEASAGIESMGLIDDGEELLHAVEHTLKDASLLNTNEMYADKVGDCRRQERAIFELNVLKTTLADGSASIDGLRTVLKDVGDALRQAGIESNAVAQAETALAQGEDAFTAALETLVTQIGAELGVRVQQLGSATTISRFFANEAYQSDGPFAHVVLATQAAEADATNETVAAATTGIDPAALKDKSAAEKIAMAKAGLDRWAAMSKQERDKLLADAQKSIDAAVKQKKTERQTALPPAECLQSFNEQLGDMLKDLEHYGTDEPGKAIIQSSKYLERLMDAMRLMYDKQLFAGMDSVLDAVEIELTLQDSVKKELIAARKGNLIMMPSGDEPVDQAEQRRAYACDFMRKLGVTSVAGLAKRYCALGVQVNAAARKSIAAMPR